RGLDRQRPAAGPGRGPPASRGPCPRQPNQSAQLAAGARCERLSWAIMVPMGEDQDWSSLAFDADGRLVDLSDQTFVTWEPPTPGRPVPVADVDHLTGRRVVLMR